MIRKEIVKDNITLVCNDCLEEMKSFPDEFADVYITSCPYNLNTKYNSYKDNLDFDNYLNWMIEVGKQVHRTLKPEGSFFLNIGGISTNPYVAMDVALRMREIFILQNNIVWVKSISINENSFGHFTPINSKRFLNHNHESVFHFTKSGNTTINQLAIGVPYKEKYNIGRYGKGKDLRCGGDVWFIPHKTIRYKKNKFNHPAVFPEELVERCIKLHGGKDLLVVDPFVGVGTTLKVCQKLGHRGIGIDIDEAYFDVSASRF